MNNDNIFNYYGYISMYSEERICKNQIEILKRLIYIGDSLSNGFNLLSLFPYNNLLFEKWSKFLFFRSFAYFSLFFIFPFIDHFQNDRAAVFDNKVLNTGTIFHRLSIK